MVEESKRQILYEFHDAPMGGHRCMNKTLRDIESRYTWLNAKMDVGKYAKQCKSCQVNKTLKPKRIAPMDITFTTNYHFDKSYLEIVVPIPPSTAGNRYILTFQDDVSKYVVATSTNQQEADTVARVFVSEVVLKYRAPSIVQSDQGGNFVSDVFKNT